MKDKTSIGTSQIQTHSQVGTHSNFLCSSWLNFLRVEFSQVFGPSFSDFPAFLRRIMFCFLATLVQQQFSIFFAPGLSHNNNNIGKNRKSTRSLGFLGHESYSLRHRHFIVVEHGRVPCLASLIVVHVGSGWCDAKFIGPSL